MIELGFTPTFYQFIDTLIEVKIAIKICRNRLVHDGRGERKTDRTVFGNGGITTR